MSDELEEQAVEHRSSAYLQTLGIDLRGCSWNLAALNAKRGEFEAWSPLLRQLIPVSYERIADHVHGAKYKFRIHYERTEIV